MPNPELPSQPIDPHEQERSIALDRVVGDYLTPDDQEFLEKVDDESERLGYVYGRLLEQGDDPDTILREHGITEEDDEI